MQEPKTIQFRPRPKSESALASLSSGSKSLKETMRCDLIRRGSNDNVYDNVKKKGTAISNDLPEIVKLLLILSLALVDE